MNTTRNFLLQVILATAVLLLLVHQPLLAQKNVSIFSPDNTIRFEFSMKNGRPAYAVYYKKNALITNGEMMLHFRQGTIENARMGNPVYSKGVDKYTLVVGKTKNVEEKYSAAVIPLTQSKDQINVNIVVRVYNDGLAFRYEFLETAGHKSFELLEENTTFTPVGNPVALSLFLPDYTSSQEGLYTKSTISDMKENSLMAVPALVEFPGKKFLAITEAALLDYAGMYLMKENGVLRSMLSPLPGNPAVKVKGRLPHRSPWRVLLISDRPGALIESNIVTNLNEPSRIKDVSWIRPGKTTFPWWNGNVVPDTLNAPGNNFVTQQFFIDFCARNNIEYHSVVEYGLHQWYTDDGVGFQPGPHPDVTTPVPGLDMKEVCDYAHSKGVDVRVWVHWGALYPRLDEAFAKFEAWGLSGMMIDFMDRDDQEMVNIQTEMLEKAAKHHLHIQFHGAYKPTGLHRTYPNELTREGTLNYEINKWDPRGLSPDHDINIPFTRMLAGSTDYHMGGFRAVSQKDFKTQYTRPLMLGTRGHMLAMYVVLESYLGMVCDYPAAYEGQDGFDFVQKVPTTWDETKVPDASVGEYVVIARRRNDEWFLGAITNTQSRTLAIPLSFLPEGKYMATVISDTAGNLNGLQRNAKEISRAETITVKLEPGGGMVAHLVRVK